MVFHRCATCHSAWRRCWADISWHTTPTGPWPSASCAIRSSPGTTTSKCTWRMCTGKRKARADYGNTDWQYLRDKSSVSLHAADTAVTEHAAYVDEQIEQMLLRVYVEYEEREIISTWNINCTFVFLSEQCSTYVGSGSRAAACGANEMSHISLSFWRLSDF